MTYITHVSDKIINYSLELERELIIIIILSIMVLFFPYFPEFANGQVNQNQVISPAENSSSEPVPWIGADLRNVSKGIANVLGIDEAIGVLVIEVSPGSPAEDAGLVGGNESVTEEVKLGGDIIIKAENKSITSKNDFNRLLRQKNVGDNLTLTVLRGDQRIDIPITVGSRPGFIYESSSVYSDSGNIDFAVYESFDLEFEISYPMQWEKVEEESNSILFESNPENSTDNFREFVEVTFEPLRGKGILQEGISRNETIRLIENRLYERTSGALSNATTSLIVSKSTNTTFAGNPARMVEYDFTLPPVGQISAKDIIILDDNELYSIRYFVQGSKLDNYYLPTIETMIRSFNISEVQKYENFDVGVRLKKFDSWSINEADEQYVDSVSFRPLIENSSEFQPEFRILETFPFQDRSDLEDVFNDTIQNMKSPGRSEYQFRLINSSAGHLENMNKMHNVTYSYGNISNGRVISTQIIALENNKLYLVSYKAAEEDYLKSAPVINKMIQSIEFFTTEMFSPSSHADTNLGLLLEYPSDMSIVDMVNQENYGSISFSFGSDSELSSADMKPEFVLNVYTRENSSHNEINHDIADQESNENKTYAITTTSKQLIGKPYFTEEQDNNHTTLQVNATFQNKEYSFRYSADGSQYGQFIATVEKIINSTKIIDTLPVKEDDLDENQKTEFAPYESVYGFRMKYPLDWIDGPIDLGNGAEEFKPKGSGENNTLSLRIEAIPTQDRKIYDFVEDNIESYAQIYDDLKIVQSDATNHGNYSAYELHYMGGGLMNMSKYIFNDKNNHVYIFSYGGEIDEFYTFLPTIEQIIESVDFIKINKSRTFSGFKVGDDPLGIAVNPITNTIYVANWAAHTVSAINGSNNELLSDIVVGNSPNAIAINPIKNTIYVTHVGLINGSISVIDGKNNTRIANVPLVMKSPIAVALNPSTDMIYVADSNSKNVSVIDGSTNKVIDSISTGLKREPYSVDEGGIGIAVDSLRNRIYIANPSTKNVTVIDGSDNSILANISISFGSDNTDTFIAPFEKANVSPSDIAVNPYTNVGYIIGVVEYSPTLEQILLDQDVPSSDQRLVAIDFANNRVTPYNVNGSLNVVALNPFANTIYINDWDSDSLYTINALKEPKEAPRAITLDLDPIVLAVDPDSNVIYVTNIGSDTVSKINGTTNKILYGVKFDITGGHTTIDNIFGVKIPFGIQIPVTVSKSVDIMCNGKNISDDEYVQYDNDTKVECSVQSIKPSSPLISSSWVGVDDSDHIQFHVTKYETLSGTFVDVDSLLQSIGPAISIFVLVAIVSAASIPSISPKIREAFGTAKKEREFFPLIPDTGKDETTILSKAEIIGVDASVIVGVLILISLAEGFEVAELTQINIITATVVFPFAISAALAVGKHEKFAIRLMIAGFICLMIAVILISLMRL